MMYCGSWSMSWDCKGGVSVCEDGLKILGVSFYKKDGAKNNWEEKIEKGIVRMNRWRCRRPTLTGKIMIIKADILPALVYLVKVFPIPVRSKLKLTRAVFSFIWGGKYERVKKEVMYGRIEEGGREVVCLPLKLDCLFVHDMCKNVLNSINHRSFFFFKVMTRI